MSRDYYVIDKKYAAIARKIIAEILADLDDRGYYRIITEGDKKSKVNRYYRKWGDIIKGQLRENLSQND